MIPHVGAGRKGGDSEIDRARSALLSLDPGVNRTDWARIGMAAKAAGLDLADFIEWSRTAPNFASDRDCADAWRSFRPGGGVTAATLFKLARDAGWRDERVGPVPHQKTPHDRWNAPARLWADGAPATGDHPYIERKRGVPDGLRVVRGPLEGWGPFKSRDLAGWLVVPAYAASGALQSVQLIGPGPGEKLNAPGAPLTGATFVLGVIEPGAVAYVVEGLGHAWTCRHLTAAAAVVTFGKANLARAADAVRAAGGRPVIVADRGAEAEAEAAARASGGGWVMLPDDLPQGADVNDLHLQQGDGAAVAALEAVQWVAGEQDHVAPLSAVDRLTMPVAPSVLGEVSEDALAIEFERRHAHDLRFCHAAGAWHIWTGTRWERDAVRRAFHYARQVCRTVSDADPKFGRAAVVAAVEKFAQAVPAMSTDGSGWDADPMLLGTPGGTVDLKTGDLRPADRSDQITKLTAVAPAPIGAQPVRWLQFLHDATRGDAALIRFLQQVAGYALTGDTSLHALFFIHGDGGNGKSVFLNALTGILADYARTAAMDTFTASRHERHPTELAMLRGARLVTASETEEGRAWAEAKIKQMTGGDPITARFMNRDFFTFLPSFKLVIVGNHKPRLHNVDPATRRRFNIIPFVHKPTTPDPDLNEALRTEWPAILRWAIEGALDWQRNGLQRPSVVVDATAEYFEEQDMLGQWLQDACEIGPYMRESVKALFGSWRVFAEANGERAGSAKAFSEALRKRGMCPYKSGSTRGFSGLRLVPEGARPDPRDPNAWDEPPL